MSWRDSATLVPGPVNSGVQSRGGEPRFFGGARTGGSDCELLCLSLIEWPESGREAVVVPEQTSEALGLADLSGGGDSVLLGRDDLVPQPLVILW